MFNIKRRIITVVFVFLSIVLFSLITYPQLLRVDFFCFNTADIGIYSQILHLSSIFNFNPYISSMDALKFNDHINIMLGIIGTFSPLFSSPQKMGIIIEYLFVILSFFPAWYLISKKSIPTDKNSYTYLAIFACGYLLFNRGIIAGINFPFHQSTWSVFAISLLCTSVLLKNKPAVLISVIFLLTFKEEYPFSVILLGLWYIVKERDYKYGSLIFGISASYILFVWGLRPILFGDTVPHGTDFIHRLFFEPVSLFTQYVHKFNHLRRAIELFIPLIPIFYILKKQKIHVNYDILPLIIAPFLLRFIPGDWRWHYSGPFAAYILFIFIPVGKEFYFSKKLFIFSMALIFLLHGGTFSKSMNGLFYTDKGLCPAIPGRLKSINQGINYLLEHNEGNALVQGNILPPLVKRPRIYSIAYPYMNRFKQEKDKVNYVYKYIMVEKKYGDRYPIKDDRFEELIKIWRNMENTKIIMEDEFILLLEGEFVDAK